MPDDSVIEWLLLGDEAIRWQVMRDVLDRPDSEWKAERSGVDSGALAFKFLTQQDPEGTWGGGLYSPKWTSTTFTLLTLMDMGISPDCPEAVRGAKLVVERNAEYFKNPKGDPLKACDLCVYGFFLSIGSYFVPKDSVLGLVSKLLLKAQMEDGGWNCRSPRVRGVKHSSFHTTFNVLDAFRLAAEAGVLEQAVFEKAQAAAIEFMLQHRMFKSDKTGEVVNDHFTEFSFPPRWHYDVLRGLDYVRTTRFSRDPRLADAVQLVRDRQNPDGTWPAQNKHPGKVFFDIESPPRRSRWNTLRALRVLKACG